VIFITDEPPFGMLQTKSSQKYTGHEPDGETRKQEV
jgi:hypothetical protein